MGCANCGLSFCNKCLKQKCKLPTKGPGEYNVCKICYSKLASGTSSVQPNVIVPPDIFINKSLIAPVPQSLITHWIRYKLVQIFLVNDILVGYRRLENLENPSAPPITVYKQDAKIQALRSGLSPADQSENEIRERLASLKGENNYVEGPSRPLYTPDNRTDQQKANSLLEQFVNERDIELSHNPQEEIEARLATLRERGVRPNEGSYISNLHDSSGSEEEMDKITKKIMDEVALDDRCPVKINTKTPSNDEEQDGTSSPELPWCVLCNKDAKYRCMDCSGDLYCSECNIEVHKTLGDTDHKVVPYKQE
ncbi:hypothetical protein NQ317_008155 [Molorchus minor]|uniref:Abscission/NoCut checkpoint regulator n=1 Tax=Molorchus minor TaxID=1323400 RepID=A0ABQ9JK23_9CUCU|nr:hypothetical protein NQ317_008155 [Molorchus minor]